MALGCLGRPDMAMEVSSALQLFAELRARRIFFPFSEIFGITAALASDLVGSPRDMDHSNRVQNPQALVSFSL